MYSALHAFFSDKKSDDIFTLFGFWHFFYIAIALVTILTILFVFKNKERSQQQKVARLFVFVAFGLYIADFFLMPFAYGEIDIEKLPFHACTAMCVMCFISYCVPALEKYRTSFAMLGLLSNLVYILYPAGVMWYGIHPLSYRVVQTLLFHAAMTIYGVLVLVYERERLDIKKCYRSLLVTACMVLWAMIGNYTYSGAADGYSRSFNWFFAIYDPLNLFPGAISPYIMPWLNIVLFFAAEMLIYCIVLISKKIQKRAVL